MKRVIKIESGETFSDKKGNTLIFRSPMNFEVSEFNPKSNVYRVFIPNYGSLEIFLKSDKDD